MLTLKKRSIALLVLGASLVVGQGVFAASQPESPEAELKRLFPRLPVASVKKTDIAGLYEVVSDGNVIYFVPKNGYVIAGEIFTPQGKNLTAEARDSLLGDKVKLLTKEDLKKAVKVGKGKHVVIEVTDPDCPYCRKMHEYWSTRPDVTRYIFFKPLSMHPNAEKKARYILAAKDQDLALWDVFSGKFDNDLSEIDKPIDDKGLMEAHKAITAKLQVQSTPMFWVGGKLVRGANIPQIESLIGKCKVPGGGDARGAVSDTCADEGK